MIRFSERQKQLEVGKKYTEQQIENHKAVIDFRYTVLLNKETYNKLKNK